MRSRLTCCFFLFISLLSFAQTEYHLLVKFNRKSEDYNLNSPEEYLSEKTILRRAEYGFEIDSTDLPLEVAFLDSLQTLNLSIECRSKWNNCVVVSTLDSSIREVILSWDFVNTVESIGYNTSNKRNEDKLDYGESWDQNQLINLVSGHTRGYTGENIDIAIIDAGFKNLNNLSIADSIFTSDRLLSTYDFVDDTVFTYTKHGHGTLVSSVLLSNQPGVYVGAAPHANYHLLISEDIAQENKIEEYHLIEAIEYCDSAGVDVINISLGYSTFNSSAYSHNKNEFTGDSTVLNQTCNRAWSLGNFIVSSAGNEGASSWGVLTAPSNADSVFCVGAIDLALTPASFSSKGNPTVNQTQKPNVVALGKGVSVVQTDGVVIQSNGTSFSSPQIAGFVACLMEAFPNAKNWEIRRAIEISSNQYHQPDSIMGYGYPDFEKSFQYLNAIEKPLNNTSIILFPNPSTGTVVLFSQEMILSITITDLQGKIIHKQDVNATFDVINLEKLTAGKYVVSFKMNEAITHQKLIIK